MARSTSLRRDTEGFVKLWRRRSSRIVPVRSNFFLNFFSAFDGFAFLDRDDQHGLSFLLGREDSAFLDPRQIQALNT